LSWRTRRYSGCWSGNGDSGGRWSISKASITSGVGFAAASDRDCVEVSVDKAAPAQESPVALAQLTNCVGSVTLHSDTLLCWAGALAGCRAAVFSDGRAKALRCEGDAIKPSVDSESVCSRKSTISNGRPLIWTWPLSASCQSFIIPDFVISKMLGIRTVYIARSGCG
jgi:hypothetical protein